METLPSNQNTGLVKKEQLQELMNLNDIYAANKGRCDRGTVKMQEMLDKIAAQGMSDTLAEEVNQLLVIAKKTYTVNKDFRSPITRLFDDIRSRLTDVEAPLDPTKKDNLFAKLLAHLTAHAQAKLDEKKRKEKEAQDLIAKQTEEATCRAEIVRQLAQIYLAEITGRKKTILEVFNSITLENFDAQSEKVKTMFPSLRDEDFNRFKPNIIFVPHYTTPQFVASAITEIISRDIDTLQQNYQEVMQEFRDDLILKLPSQKLELERMAKADAEELQRLNDEKAQRELIENTKVDTQASEASAAVQNEADRAKTEGSLNAMAQATIQFGEAAPKVRESQEIIVKHPAGWMLIAQFYFEKEGLWETNDKLEKKTLGQMKAFCEKHVMKAGEMITSEHLEYRDKIKAVVSK